MRRREAIALIAALIFGSLAPQSALPQADEQSFQFGLIGDVPYANAQEQSFSACWRLLMPPILRSSSTLVTCKEVQETTIQIHPLVCFPALIKGTSRFSVYSRASGIP